MEKVTIKMRGIKPVHNNPNKSKKISIGFGDIPTIDTVYIKSHKRIVRVGDVQNIMEETKKANSERELEERLWNNLIEQGAIKNNTKLIPRQYQCVNNAWIDEPCFIVGAGKSLEPIFAKYGFNFLDGKHTLGINHTIEDYDGFEWFIFMDQRFLDLTTYDINKFNGRIFAKNTATLVHGGNVSLFHTNSRKPSSSIEEGLYHPHLSGTVALNLALISGANPIYLLGYGNGKDANCENYHYKKDYTGEEKSGKVYTKMTNAQRYYKDFKVYKNRIVHVSDGDDIKEFDKMGTDLFADKFIIPEPVIKIEERLPKIVHLGFSNDLNQYEDTTRYIVKKCYGIHEMVNIKTDVIPNADLYIFENMISTNIHALEFPYKNKAINIVHTCNCFPKGNWRKVVALTDTWGQELRRNKVENIQILKSGVEIKAYKDIWPDYNKKIFGRAVRLSRSKVLANWNMIVAEILREVKDAKCLIYTPPDRALKEFILQHPRMIYNHQMKFTDMKGYYLKEMSIYVHANNTFRDTMSHAVIEAMATGLPVIFLQEDVIKEVTGNAGIECQTHYELKSKIIKLLKDKEQRIHYGHLSKERAKEWDIDNFIENINILIKDCLR